MVASVRPSASMMTLAGLPQKRLAVNASTWNIRNRLPSCLSFTRIGRASYTDCYPGVVFLRPEMRGTESSVTPVNPLNLIRLVPA